MKVKIKDLYVGDRFKAHESLWTYIGQYIGGDPVGRCHGKHSIDLGEKGYGYHLDSLCSFEETEEVEFIPV